MAHILVVDDDPDVLTSTSRLLEAERHTVSTADSAEAALDFLAKTSVDLAIIDVVMPEKGGIEAIMEIYSDHRSTPTIVMSGKVPLGAEAVASLMQRYGARAVLSKPFTGEELLSVVASSLEPSA